MVERSEPPDGNSDGNEMSAKSISAGGHALTAQRGEHDVPLSITRIARSTSLSWGLRLRLRPQPHTTVAVTVQRRGRVRSEADGPDLTRSLRSGLLAHCRHRTLRMVTRLKA